MNTSPLNNLVSSSSNIKVIILLDLELLTSLGAKNFTKRKKLKYKISL